MNLAIDIGNKKIKIAVFRDNRIIEIFDCLTEKAESLDFPERWKDFKIEKCGISSVVPEVNFVIEKKINLFFKIKPIILNYKDCKIKVKIKNPHKAGIDRIVNCKSACEIFGFPVIVIDIGTATTIDFVDKYKSFIGGFILPGPELWTNSLKKTALIKNIGSFFSGGIGKDTVSAINLGMKYGLAGGIEKIVYKIKKNFGESIIVLTGGYCMEFSRYLNFDKKIRKYLTLEGINIILEENEN
ncbi:MAG: type III pantothenate kinase [Candidatus Omnitrophica bacterium]|nr:type III pantothenate kinase [Candidatus Omnitrophota bacterium]